MEESKKTTLTGRSTRAKRSRELQGLVATTATAASSSSSAQHDNTTNGSSAEPSSKRSRGRTANSSVASSNPLLAPLVAPDDRKRERWQAHQLADDYVEIASKIALQGLGQFGPYGFDPENGSYPLEAVSVLRFLKSPMRRTSVLERWAPLEIALFEAALSEHGKEFHKVQREIKTKNTREVIDFYYIWKKTAHYQRWKKQYVPPYLDASDEEPADDRKPPAR